jgi:hypothetical protein
MLGQALHGCILWRKAHIKLIGNTKAPMDPPSPLGPDNDDDDDFGGPSSSPPRAPSPSSPPRATRTPTPPAPAKGKKNLIPPTSWNPREAEGCCEENRLEEEISIRDDQRGTGGAYAPRGDRSFQI